MLEKTTNVSESFYFSLLYYRYQTFSKSNHQLIEASDTY